MISNDPTDTLQETENQDTTLQGARKEAEKKRIESWKERYTKERPTFSYSAQRKNEKIHINAKFNDSDLTEIQKVETHQASLCAATGTTSGRYGQLILEQTIAALYGNKAHDDTFIANVALEALLAINPADEYEGMLCSRLLVLHKHYMDFMGKVAPADQSSQGIDLNINRATKLMRLYNETLETLNRYRRKGEQKVTVQHVNVNNGGRAVVAGQFIPGDDNTKT